MVLDGNEGPKYDRVLEGPVFSPNCERVAYVALRDGKMLVVVDGKEGPKYDAVQDYTLVFSPDSKRVAYTAVKEDHQRMFLVLDAQEGKEYVGGIGKTTVAFSPDSKRVAFAAADRDHRWFMVMDGTPEAKHDYIRRPVFSPDSKRLAYVATERLRQEGERSFVVVDGRSGRDYDEIGVLTTSFSPDSKRVAYGALRHGEAILVLDGNEGPTYKSIGPPTFSPDSNHVAYRAHNRPDLTRGCLVLDGQPGPVYDFVRNLPSARTPNAALTWPDVRVCSEQRSS